MKESIFIDRVRDVCAIIDRAIYGLIDIFYDTIEVLSRTSVLSGGDINDLAMKIYGLLSVFMIFKISFSLINYIVNPDVFSDKAKGGGALIKNIMITIVLIISVPFCFDLLYRAQNVIISDGILQKYIMGGDTSTPGYSLIMDEDYCSSPATTNKTGDYIGLMAFRPFFQISDDAILEDDVINKYCSASVNGGSASVTNLLKNDDVYSAPHGFSVDEYYVVEYSIFLSGIIGLVVALLFLSFCFDVAVRTIKLAFLELIAPIPIISYIDPDSSKNGMFKKWMKETFNTWLSLFMRLGAIYFAIYIIGKLASMDVPGNSLWIKLLIIIGALIFAKQLPKLLENILGIKLGESFSLNPFKKLESEALGIKGLRTAAGVATGAALGAVGGAAANAWAAGINNKKAMEKIGLKGQNWSELSKADKAKYRTDFISAGGRTGLRTAGSIFAGAGSSAVRSGLAGKDGKFKPFKNADTGITASSTARSRRESGYGIISGVQDKATDMAHISQSYGTTDMLKNKKKAREQRLNELVARTESLRDQSAYYRAQNPNKALAFNDAGRMNWIEKDGKQTREFAFKNYDEYLNDFQDRLDKATGEDLDRLNAIGILDKDDFERARAFDQQINDNDDEIQKIKKEISKIEENMKKK